MGTSKPYQDALEVRPLEGWSAEFWQALMPAKQAIVDHPLFRGMGDGSLPVEQFCHALLNFYPLVENFPKYMALNLAKVRLGVAGHEEAKNWLIDNIKIEQRHAYWYEDWAGGFGIDRDTLHRVTPPPQMNAINDYLWDTGHQATLEQGIAATNIGIEWATGEWSQYVVEGMRAYQARGEMAPSRRTMAWLRAHATYDDLHPYEAMELVRRICDGNGNQEACLEAALTGMTLYRQALDDCLRVSAVKPALAGEAS